MLDRVMQYDSERTNRVRVVDAIMEAGGEGNERTTKTTSALVSIRKEEMRKGYVKDCRHTHTHIEEKGQERERERKNDHYHRNGTLTRR